MLNLLKLFIYFTSMFNIYLIKRKNFFSFITFLKRSFHLKLSQNDRIYNNGLNFLYQKI